MILRAISACWIGRSAVGTLVGVSVVLGVCGLSAPASAQTSCDPNPSVWRLTFEDNFAGSAIDATKWRVENATLVKNNELQTYVPDEVSVAGGVLSIRSQRRTLNGRAYTSGLVDTINRFSQTYGRFEARIRVPRTQGIWPAFWMLSQSGVWPPEIDILEMRGQDPFTVVTTQHWGPFPQFYNFASSSFTGPIDLSLDFHTYAVEWFPNRIDWYVDGVLRFTNTTNIPSQPMYLILNTAVGGDFLGNPDASTVFPQTMQVDWVRAYTRGDLPATPNIIRNRGFDEASAIANPTVALPEWGYFGNASMSSETALSLGNALKTFGNFTGAFNVSGVTQSVIARPGQVWRASASLRHRTGDVLAGGNTAIVKLDWLNSAGTIISSTQVTGLTASSARDVWLPAQVQAAAPAGTVRAQIALLFLQPALASGAAFFDDAQMILVSSPPVCRGDFNGDSIVSVTDIFSFLSAWFSGYACADINTSGSVNVTDIFDFLALWFQPC